MSGAGKGEQRGQGGGAGGQRGVVVEAAEVFQHVQGAASGAAGVAEDEPDVRVRARHVMTGVEVLAALCAGVAEADCVVPPERLCVDQCPCHPWLVLRESQGLEGAIRDAQGWFSEALVVTGRGRPDARLLRKP
jgi:hypothetical protein